VVLSLGVAVGPYMIGVFTLGERICPPGRVALGMTLLGSMVGVGYAVGAGVAGPLTDAHGYSAAFLVTVIATGAAFGLSALSQRAFRRATATQAVAAENAKVTCVAAAGRP
jgi:predicted MFS family arabinose efflux permease